MTAERLELTVLFGERARADGGFLADAIAAIFARHELHLSVVLRGMADILAALERHDEADSVEAMRRYLGISRSAMLQAAGRLSAAAEVA